MAATGITRLHPEQVDAVRALLAAHVTPRTADSWRQDDMTALLMGDPANPVAAMSMSRRIITIAPGGRSMRVGWLSANMFPMRMAWRRIARKSTDAWPELLPELTALIAVRRDAESVSARWYDACGFHSILPIRCLYWDVQQAPPSAAGPFQAQVIDLDQIGAWRDRMSALYENVYGQYGGPRVRGAGFYPSALEHHYYRDHYHFQILCLLERDALVGYAIVGWTTWHSKVPRLDILELATRQWDARAAQELILAAGRLAMSHGSRQVRAVISAHDPYRPHFTRAGFEDRWGYRMLARFLHAQRYLDGLSRQESFAPVLDHTGLSLSGPGAPAIGLPGSGSGGAINLRGDGGSITRLLLQRLELSSALREGTIVATNATDADAARLSVAFFWSPWVFHMLDFI